MRKKRWNEASENARSGEVVKTSVMSAQATFVDVAGCCGLAADSSRRLRERQISQRNRSGPGKQVESLGVRRTKRNTSIRGWGKPPNRGVIRE
jgi:hypothetical protein